MLKIFLLTPSLTILASTSVVALILWIFKEWRKKTITEVFICDMAINHLPHIYHTLMALARGAGIEVGEPPPVKFISPKDFEGK